MNFNKIMEASPLVEVAVRYVYWHTDFLTKRLPKKETKAPVAAQTTIQKIVSNLKSRGISKGDLILVHSSYRSMRKDKASPQTVLDALRELVGEEGTIVMPAIPFFEGGPKGLDRIYGEVEDIVLTYDPVKTPVWTGVLVSELIKQEGAVRSQHPLNTIVAWGPLAYELSKDDLKGEAPAPNGLQSSWFKMYERNAKILMIGVDVAHSLTSIHTAEDMHGDDWVVPDWFRKRKFRLVTPEGEKLITVRERRPKWGMLHYAERTLNKDLREEKIVSTDFLDEVPVSILETKALVDFLNSKNHTGYPYSMVPLKSK